VNRSGLEYRPSAIPEEEIARIRDFWRANIVRLPFNQDWVLHRPGYPELLDGFIECAARHGMYTLLDLQWLDDRHSFGPGRQFVAPLPNEDSPGMWAALAARYRGNPAVMFDIFNEPHDVSMEEWQRWALRLIDAIREEAPETMLFVSGVEWAYDLRGFSLDRENLVYSTHVYRNKKDRWVRAFGELALEAPVFAGEFGGGEEDLEWGRRLLDYFDELAIGWTAWSLTDRPHLATPAGEPTAFGSLVRERLVNPTIEVWTSS
jgi:hypothetical protein